VQELEINFDRASPDTFCFSLLAVRNTSCEPPSRESELILLGETADIAILSEESNEYVRVAFGVLLRTRSVIEKCDAFLLVSLPKVAQRDDFRRRDIIVPEDCYEELLSQSFSL
jgi:hypothetical protein